MSGPIHHLDEELLLDYVSGAASEPVALLAACHLTLCAACRASAAAAEAVGGALLEQTPLSPVSAGALSRMLARLDQAPAENQAAPRVSGDGADAAFVFAGVALPRPLRRYLKPEAAAGTVARQFRFLAPGVRGVDLPAAAAPQVRTRLLRLAAGLEIPRHSHAAPELTLVFSGGFSDDGEHYGPGDIRTRDTAAVHVQRIDADAPCIALVINQGALLPRTWRGRVVSLLFDH